MLGKTTADYNVAFLKIRNAQNKVIGSGACSTADLLTEQSLKFRLDLPNGKSYRGTNTTKKNFVIKDNEGSITEYDRITGKVIATNKVDTTIVDKEITQDECCIKINEKNIKGDVVRKTSFYSNMSYGTIYVTKTLPDGSIISIKGGPEFINNKPIYSTDCFNFIYENPFNHKTIHLSNADNETGIRTITFDNGDWIEIDKQQNIISTYRDCNLLGQTLTEELKQRLGIKELFDAINEVPTEDEFIKMVQKFPGDKLSNIWADKRIAEKSAAKAPIQNNDETETVIRRVISLLKSCF